MRQLWMSFSRCGWISAMGAMAVMLSTAMVGCDGENGTGDTTAKGGWAKTIPANSLLFKAGDGYLIETDLNETWTFGGQANAATLTPSDTDEAMMARWKDDGTLAWAQTRSENSGIFPQAIGDDGSHVLFDTFTGSKKVSDSITLTCPDGSYGSALIKRDADGTVLWATSMISSYQYNRPTEVLVAPDGTVLVYGNFRGTSTLASGTSQATTLTSSVADSSDVFVARYAANGTLMWARTIVRGSDASVSVEAATAGNDGSLTLIGEFNGTVTFEKDSDDETSLASIAEDTICISVFIAKYNSDGTLAFAHQIGNSDAGCSLVETHVNSDGSFVLLGNLGSEVTFGEGESNETTLSCIADKDRFLAKYGSDGQLAWAKRLPAGLHITPTSSGKILVRGSFSGQATFGSGEVNETTVTSTLANASDNTVAVYNSDGSFASVVHLPHDYSRLAYLLVTDLGDSYAIVGLYSSSADDTGGVFIAKYAFDGTKIWERLISGDYSSGFAPYACIRDSSGAIVIGGEFIANIVLGKGEANEITLTSNGEYDAFLVKYSADGTLVWARSFGGPIGDNVLRIFETDDHGYLVNGAFGGCFFGIIEGADPNSEQYAEYRTTPKTIVLGAGEANEVTLTSPETLGNPMSGVMYIAKYNADGTLAEAAE